MITLTVYQNNEPIFQTERKTISDLIRLFKQKNKKQFNSYKVKSIKEIDHNIVLLNVFSNDRELLFVLEKRDTFYDNVKQELLGNK